MSRFRGFLRSPLMIVSIPILILGCFLIFPLDLKAQTLPSGSRSFLTSLLSNRTARVKASFRYNLTFPTIGQAVQFTDTSSGNPTSWLWDFGDGSTSGEQHPSHAFATVGFHRVTLTASNTTSSRKASRILSVTPVPAAATFVYSPPSPTAGQTVQFADTTAGDPTSWQWDFGDGVTSTAKNPNHVYSVPASYTVTLRSTNRSGSKSANKTITVQASAAVVAAFSYTPAYPETGKSVQFTDTSTGPPTSWLWDFGDGTTSTTQHPIHAYTSAGSKTVMLSAANSSTSNSTTRTVTIAVTLTASFSYSPASPVMNQAVQFTDTSTGTPVSWLWNFGDGVTSSAQNPSHTFATAGSKSVTLTVTNSSGSNAMTRTVPVVAALTAAFNYSPAAPVAGQSVIFTDTSTGSPSLWQWSFGDGTSSTSQHPIHTYASEGAYNVSLTIMNSSGQDNINRLITVMPASSLSASFVFSPASPAEGHAVQFTDTSTGNPTSWQWNFSDGATSTSQNPSHSFMDSGSYAVALTISNGSDTKTVTQSINVTPSSTLTASFTHAPSLPIVGQTVNFTDTSDGSPVSWQWDFGDGSTSSVQNPSHVYSTAGTKTVTLTVIADDGSNSTSSSLEVLSTSSGVPSDRVVDWGRAGVWYNGVKGIPTFPVGITMQTTNSSASYYIDPTGVADCTASFNAAVSACPPHHAVSIPPGTFRIIDRILIYGRSGIVLRGAGPNLTRIIRYGAGHIIQIAGSSSDAYTACLSGYTKGSQTIVVADPSLFQVGDVVSIDQLDDPHFVNIYDCSYCGREVNGSRVRAMAQFAVVTGINGSSIHIDKPLYYTFKSEFRPELGRHRGYAFHCGIENLYVEQEPGVATGSAFRFSNVAHCWVRNVHSYNVGPGHHVNFYLKSYGCEIRDSYFERCQSFAGSSGYGVAMSLGAYDNLIENNVFYFLHTATVIEAGGSGNVVAYNYCERMHFTDLAWFIVHLAAHASHPWMNLWEGNVAAKLTFDDFNGSGSHNMIFRNRLHVNNMDGGLVIGPKIAIELMEWNYYCTALGNILGEYGVSGFLTEVENYSSSQPVLWKNGWGYGETRGIVTWEDGLKTRTTLIREGNYEYADHNAAQWENGPINIPDSMYLEGKPAWWGEELAWPPFTPERPGFNPSTPNKIPAQTRFETKSTGVLSSAATHID